MPGQDVEWLPAPYSSLSDGETGETSFDGKDRGFAVDLIRVVARNDFLEINPAARSLFEAAQIDINDISAQNKLIADGEDSSEDIHRHVPDWVATHQAEYDA